MHALAEFRIALALGQEVGARALVARRPGRAAVAGVEDARRRNRHPDPLRIVGIEHDRMQDQPAAAGLPIRTRRWSRRPFDRREALAAVVADEQARRLDADVKTAVRERHAPRRLDRRLARRIGEAPARMRPARAAVGRLPHRRAEPFVAAGAVDRAVARIADDVMNRPSFAKRPGDPPRSAPFVAFENEDALL